MNEKPEALRLADSLRDGVPYDEAEIENELRRLSAENETLRRERDEARRTLREERDEAIRTVREAHEAGTRLTTQRDALLTLLRRIRAWDMMDAAADGPHWKREIDAAIKAVEGEKE